jgi:hypothetical protein
VQVVELPTPGILGMHFVWSCMFGWVVWILFVLLMEAGDLLKFFLLHV